MSYRDRTGPEGMGPLTGRGLGNCTKEEAATTAGYNCGYGIGRRGAGRGMGRGCRPGGGRRFYQPLDRQVVLNDEKEILKRRLAEIENLLEKSE
jgi:hypothetical protein